jgi:branched-chain amino acid transport system substrate-binding protein
MGQKTSLFEELKQRNVFRIGAMYLVAGWILLQFGEVMIDIMALPLWMGRALVVLLALGFPFVVLLAWVFDVSTRGLIRAESDDASEIDRSKASRVIDMSIMVVLVIGIGVSFYFLQPKVAQTINRDEIVEYDSTHPKDSAGAARQHGQYLLIGNLVDFTGASGKSGQSYGQAIIDSSNWINENGGINGQLIDLDTVETSYLVRRAINAYRKWQTQDILAIQGWGTQIGLALKDEISKDEIPYFSASYAAAFADPTGKAGREVAPYNFFYGPSYSDACRGLVQWAEADWNSRSSADNSAIRAPRFVHMGDNHPYADAPKDACAEYARELGFEILKPIVFSLIPGDFSAQCALLKRRSADYVFLANQDKSVAALLEQCHAMDITVQYMANIWGFDESVMQSAGEAANGVVWVMGAAAWHDSPTGMYTVREISKMSDPEETKYRSVHYMRGVCSMFYLKEAMERAGQSGIINGAAIKTAMYVDENWVPEGLNGVCLPATWKADDHRGVTKVLVYQASVSGDTQSTSIFELMNSGQISMDRVFEAEIPRRPEWLGY